MRNYSIFFYLSKERIIIYLETIKGMIIFMVLIEDAATDISLFG